MKTIALVGAMDFNAVHYRKQAIDFTVAVDRGYRHLTEAGLRPDAVLGDFDSLGYVPDEPDVRCFPPAKDESDMELGARLAVEEGCSRVLLYGCLGGRLDHTLANLQVIVGLARRGLQVFAIGDDHVVAAVHGAPARPGALAFEAVPSEAFAQGSYGNFVSVFAYGGPAHGVTETGLKFALREADLPDDVSLGLSNEFIGQEASIRVGDGDLVVTFPLAAWEYLSQEV